MDKDKISAMAGPPLTSILVGDELGLLKRLELASDSSSTQPKVICINRDSLDQPSPEKSVLTIRRFTQPHYLRFDADQETFSGFQDTSADQLFMITSRHNQLQIFNAADNSLHHVEPAKQEFNLAGSIPFHHNHIVNCYTNGTIYVQNIDKELLSLTAEQNRKALKVLGLDENNNKNGLSTEKEPTFCEQENLTTESEEENEAETNVSKKRKGRKKKRAAGIHLFDTKLSISLSKYKKTNPTQCTDTKKTKKVKSTHETKTFIKNRELYSPNFNVNSTTLDCFEIQTNHLAIGGKNNDLKVFDLDSGKCTFTAKPPPADWLGLRQPIWVSGISWLGLSHPTLLATCSRTEPVIRIYDTRSESKAMMTLNLKDKGGYHPNPPAFTSICSARNVFNRNNQTHQLIVGSTVGRMACVDVRMNTQTYQTSGAFKGFGGSIRDIKHVPETPNTSKVLSCCLDRFIRVHDFNNTGFEKSKELRGKYYMKTRLVCMQPIFGQTGDGTEKEGDEVLVTDNQ